MNRVEFFGVFCEGCVIWEVYFYLLGFFLVGLVQFYVVLVFYVYCVIIRRVV